jgi:hypothetical protein
MQVIGVEWLASAVRLAGFSAKMVFNGKGAIFFPVSRQHRDQRAEGIAYDDDYKGNALAAMLEPGRIEIRFHKAFTDAAVTDLVRALLEQPALSFMRGWTVTYQGRALNVV